MTVVTSFKCRVCGFSHIERGHEVAVTQVCKACSDEQQRWQVFKWVFQDLPRAYRRDAWLLTTRKYFGWRLPVLGLLVLLGVVALWYRSRT